MNYTTGNYKFNLEEFFPKNLFYQITEARVEETNEIIEHAKNRKRRTKLTKDGKLIILAADHPGRRVTALRNDPILKARRTLVKSLDTPQFALEYLKRKKKDEFSDRQELTGKNGEDLIPKPILDLSNGVQENNSDI